MKKRRPLPVLSVIDHGILRGFVPVDRNWHGFSVEDYRAACESVGEAEPAPAPSGKRLFMGGYQEVRADYFPSHDKPSMTIANGKLRFNTACLKKFEDVEYVELLLNTVTNTIAIRPCAADNPNAIRWGKLRDARWVVNTMGCRGLSRTLFSLMSWEDEGKYVFRGQFIQQGAQKLLVFELAEPVVTKTVEQIVVPEQPEEADSQQEEIVIKETVRIYPAAWTHTFGTPVSCAARVSWLEQRHYAGDWDVLRPATELEELNLLTQDKLDELLKEAESIMEGWARSA